MVLEFIYPNGCQGHNDTSRCKHVLYIVKKSPKNIIIVNLAIILISVSFKSPK